MTPRQRATTQVVTRSFGAGTRTKPRPRSSRRSSRCRGRGCPSGREEPRVVAEPDRQKTGSLWTIVTIARRFFVRLAGSQDAYRLRRYSRAARRTPPSGEAGSRGSPASSPGRVSLCFRALRTVSSIPLPGPRILVRRRPLADRTGRDAHHRCPAGRRRRPPRSLRFCARSPIRTGPDHLRSGPDRDAGLDRRADHVAARSPMVTNGPITTPGRISTSPSITTWPWMM